MPLPRTSAICGLLALAAVLGGPARAAELPRVPDGYVIQRIAAAPLVQHPMMACFDDRGRPDVCDSAGRTFSGIIVRETPADIVLRSTDLSEQRVARAEIDYLGQSQPSIMPQGLESRLPPDELRDLLAYLQALR